MLQSAIEVVSRLLNIEITLEGFSFTIGTAVLFLAIAGLLAVLIGGLLK